MLFISPIHATVSPSFCHHTRGNTCRSGHAFAPLLMNSGIIYLRSPCASTVKQHWTLLAERGAFSRPSSQFCDFLRSERRQHQGCAGNLGHVTTAFMLDVCGHASDQMHRLSLIPVPRIHMGWVIPFRESSFRLVAEPEILNNTPVFRQAEIINRNGYRAYYFATALSKGPAICIY